MTLFAWPVCAKCERSIEVHYLRGNAAYCARTDETDSRGRRRWRYVSTDRATFSADEVHAMRRNLGHKITQKQIEAAARDRGNRRQKVSKQT